MLLVEWHWARRSWTASGRTEFWTMLGLPVSCARRCPCSLWTARSLVRRRRTPRHRLGGAWARSSSIIDSMRSVLINDRNIRRVRELRDLLRRISLSRCLLCIRRRVSATHLRVRHSQRKATQCQGWSETRSPNNQECATRSDSTNDMKVESETQVSVQHKDKTKCSRGHHKLTTCRYHRTP